MSIPNYFLGTPLRTKMIAPTVDDVIAEWQDQITTQLPLAERWTSLGSGYYNSPADGGGDKIRLKLYNAGVNRLNMIVGMNGADFQEGSIVFVESSTDVDVLSGRAHAAIIARGGAGGAYNDDFRVHMVDPSPEPARVHNRKVFWYYSRDSFTNAFWHNAPAHQYFHPDGDGLQFRNRVAGLWRWDGDSYKFETLSALKLRTYQNVSYYNSALGKYYSAGALAQIINCDWEAGDFSEISMPIDTGIKGYFMVLPRPKLWGNKGAIRIPDPV